MYGQSIKQAMPPAEKNQWYTGGGLGIRKEVSICVLLVWSTFDDAVRFQT